MAIPRNKPKEPGFYWARQRSSTKWYSFIVHIYGDIPYLSYEAWNMMDDKIETGTDPSYYFGPKIAEAEVPKDMITPIRPI